MGALFGPAGNSESFYDEGFKNSIQMPGWLKDKGLDCYEYQCGKGVNVGEKTAVKLGEEARANGILMTLHAPYFISLSSADEEVRERSIGYIIESAVAADWMGATRIVIHSGSAGKMEREAALGLAKETLVAAIRELDERGLSHITLCPETMGKINQLGNLEEVMELCKLDERLIPTIDFGHINARSHGGLMEDSRMVEGIFDTIENELGIDRLRIFHSHFSKIEWTAGGEKRHLTFEDTQYGPNFEPVAELTYKKGLSPVFICESAGTMAQDALEMKRIYESFAGK